MLNELFYAIAEYILFSLLVGFFVTVGVLGALEFMGY